jgi:hypothetical protein
VSRHRAEAVRPRWGRLVLAGAAATVTAVALVGGAVSAESAPGSRAVDGGSVASSTDAPAAGGTTTASDAVQRAVVSGPVLHRDKTLPADSGSGYRVVFSESRQRVWLVGEDDDVERTYLVSGSLYDNLDPGSYAVYSRSEKAVGIDDSGTMNLFVRFAQGPNAAIGFHDIPIDDNAPVQTNAELGTPQSHGCIRQKPVDAAALWDFAPLGTPVVVTA